MIEFRIGQRMRQLDRAGEMPKEEAEGEMLAAFQFVIDDYPDTKWAGYAKKNIEQHEELKQ